MRSITFGNLVSVPLTLLWIMTTTTTTILRHYNTEFFTSVSAIPFGVGTPTPPTTNVIHRRQKNHNRLQPKKSGPELYDSYNQNQPTSTSLNSYKSQHAFARLLRHSQEAIMSRGGGSSSIRSSSKVGAQQQQQDPISLPSLTEPIKIFAQTIYNSRRHLMSAAIARTISIFAMYPIDAIKTRIQLEQSNAFRLAGLWKGVGGSLAGQVPYGVLTFGSYEMYKQTLLNNFYYNKQKDDDNDDKRSQPVLLYAIAAILGDLTGSGWICPSEVVKQQVQAGMHKNTVSAIQSIYQKNGLGGFYQGYVSGISRDVPFRVAQLTAYEFTKGIFLKMKKQRLLLKQQKQKNKEINNTIMNVKIKNVELTPIEAAICGAISGSFSAAITSPLDRIKTLLMTDSAKYGGGGVIQCATKLWAEEGMRGMTTGMIPRVIYIAPSVVIFFVVYEMSQQKFKQLLE